MAFMGMVFAGAFLVIAIVAAGIYLFIGFVLFITGLIGVVRDKMRARAEAAQTQAQTAPITPYKKKKALYVVMCIGAGMWIAFAVFAVTTIIYAKVSYDEGQASRNLFSRIHDNDFTAARELLDAGAYIDSAGNTNADSFAPAQPGEDSILFSLCNREVHEEDEETLARIEFLLENGADVEWQVYSEEKSAPEHSGGNAYGFELPDRCGMTPLMAAASSGRVETVKLLLEHGADVNATTYSGVNALMYAAISFMGERAAEVARLLIENGIDVHAYDNFGQNVWDYVQWSEADSVREVLSDAAVWSPSELR